MGNRPSRARLGMAPSMTLRCHHPISQHPRLYLSPCIARLRLPRLLSSCLPWPQRTHMLSWIGLSRGSGSWGLQTELLLGMISMDYQWPICWPKFKMSKIERYTRIGCPRIHLRLYSTIMRAHGLNEAQMIMFFPMSLSGAAQRWFASLDVSRHWTWNDLAQEFLR